MRGTPFGRSAPTGPTGRPGDAAPDHPSRRAFLSFSGRALGGGWLALHLPAFAALSACAREDAENGEPFEVLAQEEGRTLQAMVTRLIPSVDGIGAREAGAAHFIDRALGSFFSQESEFVRGELARVAEDGFADLPTEEQIAYLEGIEDTPFFGLLMAFTVFGTFSDPRHGGGRNDAIQRIYGIEILPGWDPPFGHYDAEVTQ